MDPSRLIKAMLQTGQAFTVTIATAGREMTITNPTATTTDVSPSMSLKSPSTATTTPAAEDQDDIWGDEDGVATREEVLSDLPSVKRQHMTDGFREGLSVGKAQVMQCGFDNGYPIGVQIAMRVGPVLGVLDAYLACKSINVIPGMLQKVQSAYDEASHDLSITNLLKNQDEAMLLMSTTIPEAVEATISFWEGKVTAFYETRRTTMAIQERENPHELREIVETAKHKDPKHIDADRTDKVSLGPAVQEGMEESKYRYKGRKPEW